MALYHARPVYHIEITGILNLWIAAAMIRLFFFLLFFPLWAFGQFPLSTCAIFKNEAPFLREWIEFHKLQGCEHFYLYNNNSTDTFREILAPYIDSGEVTLIDWPYTYARGNHDEWIAIQAAAYVDCIQRYGKESVWIAFIDIDEFLFSPSGKIIPRILRRYMRQGAVGVYWRIFGTSCVEELTEHQCLIEALTRCTSAKNPLNWLFKSIVRPDCVSSAESVHFFTLKRGFYTVLSDKRGNESIFLRPHTEPHADLIINHYWTRTEKHLRAKIQSEIERGRLDALNCYTKHYNCNECEDTTILQFVPTLRKALDYD